ncbi:MAG: HPr family phosphocarrier protein [Pseudomonadales bacterium]|jgi:phosphotransferase system HPr (HPr) family protein|nr:HPr family phosphocarrier protein [Pseudomonadales bacterium]MDA0760478.1 HPr family phosphocarrier protein [Pseudomonadota bacterium]MDA0958111.1 HPr family phosphocarrier protein [Pseudomonadota bacterium]MDA1206064.1 HPr family phosphocarrier protein [Pseudomonadota bacterium]
MKLGSTRVTNPPGLHARSAAGIVKLAKTFHSIIELTVDDKRADASNIMALLMLEAICGTKVEVTASGTDEAEALSAIIAFIENDFGEAGIPNPNA